MQRALYASAIIAVTGLLCSISHATANEADNKPADKPAVTTPAAAAAADQSAVEANANSPSPRHTKGPGTSTKMDAEEVAVTTGSHAKAGVVTSNQSDAKSNAVAPAQKDVKADREIPSNASVQPHSAPDQAAIQATSESAFGIARYKQLAEATPSANIFISPYSIYSCLHLAYNGARKQTASEMAQILGLKESSAEIGNDDEKKLTDQLTSAGGSEEGPFVFHCANSLWANMHVKVKPEFVSLSKKYFGAQVENLNFSDSDKAANAINSWVNQETHGKIDRIVDKTSEQDLLLLVNAAYFKASWQNVFRKDATRTVDFHTDKADTKAQLMHISKSFNYLENNDLQAIELPYSNCDNSMFVFLPKQKTSLANFAHTLSSRNWDQWIGEMSQQQGELDLPKFTMHYQTSCKKMLSAAGMKLPFSAQADFSGMLTPPPAAMISDVLHKTFVKVDEDGTEAAAVTAMMERSLGMPNFSSAKPFKMVVDHPFFFAVMNKKNRALLFVGQVTDPSES